MAASLFHTCSVGDLVRGKRPLITAPDTASVGEVLRILEENRILAVAIVAPCGKWPGTGERTMVERRVGTSQGSISDRSDCQQYVAIVSVLDVIMHMAREESDWERSGWDLNIPVTTVIGNSPEGRLLWSIRPSAALVHAMDPLSKGIHRLVVPLRQTLVEAERPFGEDTGDICNNVGGKASIPKDVQACSAFRMFTQTDMMRFLVQHMDELGPVISCSVADLGLLHPTLSALAVPASMIVKDALQLMRQHGGVIAVAVVDPMDSGEEGIGPPGWSRGGKLVGTLSASDFRGLDAKAIRELHLMPVMEFLARTGNGGVPCPLVSCRPTTPLATVMAEAVTSKVHRVWVTEEDNRLLGVVTFTDMIRAINRELLVG